MGLPKIIKKIIPESWLYEMTLREQHRKMLNEMTLDEWQKAGCPAPPPSAVKWAAMKSYAAKYKATHFVETGTFMGDTSWVMRDVFEKVDTCELDERLAARATEKFKNAPNVKVWQGDSGVKIAEILRGIPSTTICLFWLDGHFSGGVTAKADLNTPISAEIDHIFKHAKHHIILVDDARLFFSDEADYPHYSEFEKQIRLYNPSVSIEVKDDIIRIVPN